MGFRLRKSINLGGGFKINLSKSGIGYSFGIPGMRFTQMANGRQRTTYSIPGTGLSYVEENGKNRTQTDDNIQTITDGTSNLQTVSSINMEDNSNINEFLEAINKFKRNDLTIKTIVIIISIFLTLIFEKGIFLLLGILTLISYLIYRNKNLLIKAEYNFDDENKEYFEKLNNFFKELASCNKLWIINSQYNNMDAKRNAGSSTSITRTPIIISKNLPYYLSTNIECHCISFGTTSLYFLPDQVLIDSGKRTTVMDFEKFIFEFDNTIFVEEETVSNDSEIVDYTWQYVNKDGTPDKRFKDNPKYPKCNYGSVLLKNNSGINISILLSSYAKTKHAELCYHELTNYCHNLYKYCIKCNEKISNEAKFCKYCGTKQN